jgi:hypothetical protein
MGRHNPRGQYQTRLISGKFHDLSIRDPNTFGGLFGSLSDQIVKIAHVLAMRGPLCYCSAAQPLWEKIMSASARKSVTPTRAQVLAGNQHKRRPIPTTAHNPRRRFRGVYHRPAEGRTRWLNPGCDLSSAQLGRRLQVPDLGRCRRDPAAAKAL